MNIFKLLRYFSIWVNIYGTFFFFFVIKYEGEMLKEEMVSTIYKLNQWSANNHFLTLHLSRRTLVISTIFLANCLINQHKNNILIFFHIFNSTCICHYSTNTDLLNNLHSYYGITYQPVLFKYAHIQNFLNVQV